MGRDAKCEGAFVAASCGSRATARARGRAGGCRWLHERCCRWTGYGGRAASGRRACVVRCVLADFSPADFQILKQVGQQGFYEVTEWEYYGGERNPLDPSQPQRTIEQSGPAVRLYEARIIAGARRNARVMLKEFLPRGLEAGVNEAQVYQRLLESPGAPDAGSLPLATLMGSFLGAASFDDGDFADKWKREFPNAGEAPLAGSPWLVFRWEGMQTAAGLATYKQPPNYLDGVFGDLKRRRKRAFFRKLSEKALAAVGFLHDRGVVHRSLSASSMLLNTLDENFRASLEVKIRDLGFAKLISEIDDELLRKAQAAGANSPSDIKRYFCSEDLTALGYVLLEILFAYSQPVRSRDVVMNQEALKRLFEDVYKSDFDALREYFKEDPALSEGVAILDADQRSGWDFLSRLLTSKPLESSSIEPIDATLLLEHPFFRDI